MPGSGTLQKQNQKQHGFFLSNYLAYCEGYDHNYSILAKPAPIYYGL